MAERVLEGQVLEGTWEEIAQRAAELSGRRVRLTVLSDGQKSEEIAVPKTLDQALAGLTGVIHSNEGRGGSRLSESTSSDFADGLMQKRREGRL